LVVVVDAVAISLDCFEQYFGRVHEFWVGHYNFTMLSFQRILVTTFVLGASTAGLLGCGQPGALYLPTDPSAAQRATLPETLLQTRSINKAQPTSPAAPALPASSPVTP
jgi:predicted small lipoprotein YifL